MAYNAARYFASRYFAPRYWATGSGVAAPTYAGDLTFDLQMQFASYVAEVLADDPVGWWRFDEVVGTTAADVSGGDHPGTYSGTTSIIGGPGLSRRLRLFDGIDDNVSMGDVSEFDFPGTAPFSVEAWVQPGAWHATEFKAIVQKAASFGPGFQGWLIYMIPTSVVGLEGYIGFLRFRDGAQEGAVSNTAIAVNQLHHLVCVYNGTTLTVYLDGVAGTPVASSLSLLSVASPMYVGAWSGGSSFNGQIDDVVIYDSALSSDRVTAHMVADTWTSVANEVRDESPVVCEYGIFEADVQQRVAETGTLSFQLDNSGAHDALGLPGRYSPLHANKREGFDYNVPVRLQLSSSVGGGALYTKFYGRLASIDVLPNRHGRRYVSCEALDLMDDYARLPAPPLDMAFDQTGAQLVTTLLDALPPDVQPMQRLIDPGLETYETAFDQAGEERTTIRQLLHDICISGLAKCWFVGATNQIGPRFVWRNRQFASITPVVELTLNDSMVDMLVPTSRDDLVSKVQVFVHPTRVDTELQILFDLQTTLTEVRPGQVYTGLFGGYRDPNNPGERVGGTGMLQPVAITDYTMNTSSDGSGTDVTASFTVVASYTGSGVRFTITNTSLSTSGFITKLQCRGYGIYRYTAMIEHDVPSVQYGHQVLSLDMQYLNDVNIADDISNYLAGLLSRLHTRVSSVTFAANSSADLMDAALRLEPGSRIALTETMTGITASEFLINGVRYEISNASPSPLLWCTWFLEPADTLNYWSLGVAGAGELGETTVLGF